MGDEIELVSDGDGVAVFGDTASVERFLSTAGVQSRELTLPTLSGSTVSAGAGLAQAGSGVAAHAGRWVQLTEESAKAMRVSSLMHGSSPGVSRAVATTSKGKISKILEFSKPGSRGSMLTNPAMLAGAAGIMAQFAMQQTMEEITAYLAVINEKVDDVLRGQKDAALSDMIGVGLVIDDAMLKVEHVGRVSDVTWSNLHGSAQTIASTQSYALRQLDGIAEKLETKRKISDLAKVSLEAQHSVEEWLAVLARCFQLQDGLAVLELDRVLDSSPEDLDRHREALQAGRRKRRDLIAATVTRLLDRMETTARAANTQVLFHPVKADEVVQASIEVSADVAGFNASLGIHESRNTLESRRWRDAVRSASTSVAHTAVAGASASARFGAEALSNARTVATGLSATLVRRLPRNPEGIAEERAEHPTEHP